MDFLINIDFRSDLNEKILSIQMSVFTFYSFVNDTLLNIITYINCQKNKNEIYFLISQILLITKIIFEHLLWAAFSVVLRAMVRICFGTLRTCNSQLNISFMVNWGSFRGSLGFIVGQCGPFLPLGSCQGLF